MNSEQREQNAMRDLHSHESLTGLPTKSEFLSDLESALNMTAQGRDSFIVLFINLDGFRSVNESLGYEIGDQLLYEVGHRLRSAMRPQDIVAHFGADEFMVLAHNVSSLQGIDSIIQRVQRSISSPYSLGDELLTFSASTGVVINSGNYNAPDEIIRDGSIAVHQAKTLGKARHQIFDISMYQQAMLQLGMEGDLRRAIEEDEFVLHYQPFISLETQEIVGFEALIRWDRPGYGIVMPQDFISVAEKNGLIVPIGNWVLRQGCKQLGEWSRQYPEKNLHLGINVASPQISQSDVVGELTKLLHKHQLDAQKIELEITESGIIDNPVAASDVMNALKQLGVQLSIDDFGAGYSSLSQLYRFAFDILKIDRLFISQLCDHYDSSIVFVEAIIQLAKNLGMRVVAEGIENEEQFRKLNEMGCDIGQGYLFSKPMPHDEVVKLLESNQCVAT